MEVVIKDSENKEKCAMNAQVLKILTDTLTDNKDLPVNLSGDGSLLSGLQPETVDIMREEAIKEAFRQHRERLPFAKMDERFNDPQEIERENECLRKNGLLLSKEESLALDY